MAFLAFDSLLQGNVGQQTLSCVLSINYVAIILLCFDNVNTASSALGWHWM